MKHCHEITVYQRSLFITSTGFDSILGFDLDKQRFNWAMHIQSEQFAFRAVRFDPDSDDGPHLVEQTAYL